MGKTDILNWVIINQSIQQIQQINFQNIIIRSLHCSIVLYNQNSCIYTTQSKVLNIFRYSHKIRHKKYSRIRNKSIQHLLICTWHVSLLSFGLEFECAGWSRSGCSPFVRLHAAGSCWADVRHRRKWPWPWTLFAYENRPPGSPAAHPRIDCKCLLSVYQIHLFNIVICMYNIWYVS